MLTPRTPRAKVGFLLPAVLVFSLAIAGCSGDGEGVVAADAPPAVETGASRRAAVVEDQSTGARALQPRSWTGVWPSQRIRRLASGAGQEIAVLDTGITPELLETCGSCRFAGDPEAAVDDSGHGTSMVAALTGVPRHGYVGVAPRATVTIYPLAGRHGDVVDTESVIGAFDSAVRSGADVINMSLGSQTPSPRLAGSIRRATRRGITVTAAGGPDPDNLVLYPAAYPGVLAAVAAAPQAGAGTPSDESGASGDHEHAHQQHAGHHDGEPGSGRQARFVRVPLFGLQLPRYDAQRRFFRFEVSHESSDASVVLAGLLAARRSALTRCASVPDPRRFMAQVGHNAAQRQPLLAGMFRQCGSQRGL